MTAAHEPDRACFQPAPDTGGAVARVLREVEALGTDACGALVFHGISGDAGNVFLERGRVCWATATGMKRRLTDLLLERWSMIGPQSLDDVLRWCRANDMPLGEALVQSGTVSERGLRAALRQQTAEAVLHIAQSATGDCRWVPHRHRRYDARFTFATSELLVALGEPNGQQHADGARCHLERMLRGGGAGIAFERANSSPFPIATLHAEGLPAESIFTIMSWGRRLMSVAAIVAPDSLLSGAVRRSGRAIVVWRVGPLLYASPVRREQLSLKLTAIQGTLRLLTKSEDARNPSVGGGVPTGGVGFHPGTIAGCADPTPAAG